VHARSRETLLPILLMPVVLPIVISAVRGSTAVLNGLPSEDWLPWIQLLIMADVNLHRRQLRAVRFRGGRIGAARCTRRAERLGSYHRRPNRRRAGRPPGTCQEH